MARWTITKNLKITYTDERGTQDCGGATHPQATVETVLAWCAETGSVGDLIVVPRGIFVRVAGAEA
jgi:hypothetical protein